MEREKLWRRLVYMMERDADYQLALQRLKNAEAEYLTLLETMTPESREILECYIAASEALEDPLILLAYQIGLSDRDNGQ